MPALRFLFLRDNPGAWRLELFYDWDNSPCWSQTHVTPGAREVLDRLPPSVWTDWPDDGAANRA